MDPAWVYRMLPFGAALMAIGFASAWTWGKPSWPFVLALTWGGALLVMNTVVLPDLPALQVSRVIGATMKEIKRNDPSVQLAGRGYEEPTLVFYAGSNVEMFDSLDALLARAPFTLLSEPAPQSQGSTAPSTRPAPARILVAVNDAAREEFDRRGLRYYYAVLTIPGVTTGNFKPVRAALISNLPLAPTTAPATGPSETLPAVEGVKLDDLRGK
jgi:hypothetical protein